MLKIQAGNDTYIPTAYFCPICGKPEVWESDGQDYYDGADYCCAACGGHFCHPRSGKKEPWESSPTVAEQLREAILVSQAASVPQPD